MSRIKQRIKELAEPVSTRQLPLVITLTVATSVAFITYEPASMMGFFVLLSLGTLMLIGAGHIAMSLYTPAKNAAERLLHKLGKRARGET